MKRMSLNTLCICLFITLMTLSYCSKESNQEKEVIIARVGNQSITLQEFLARSELTIRPDFSAMPDSSEKIFVLNNLIAEKLLAVEGKDETELLESPVFQGQIKGIQEQAMREELYFKKARGEVQLSEEDIAKAYRLAGREYEISFYSIHDHTLADSIGNKIKSNPHQFEKIYNDMFRGEKIPSKTVTYKDPDPFMVHEAFYSKTHDIGDVIGPVQVEDNFFMVMRIDNWKKNIVISEMDANERMNDVKEKLTETKANRKWSEYVMDIMRGKEIKYTNETFIELSKIFFEIHGKGSNKINNDILKDFLKEDDIKISFHDDIFQDLLLEKKFFEIDGEIWTVGDFKNTYLSHPLVFKYQPQNLGGFQHEFNNAIINLVRDYYLNKEAYKEKLDKHPHVQKEVTMWRDAYLARFHQNKYLFHMMKRDDFDPEMMKGKENYLSVYVDSLQLKYRDKIWINKKVLKDIQLTRTPFLATKPNVPYPAVVPGFPLFTQDTSIDYGTADHP